MTTPYEDHTVENVEAGYRNLNLDGIDLNVYQQKKTLSAGMMDIALFSANANQLKNLLDSYEKQRYYHVVLVLIVLSLLIQIAIGVLLLWNSKYNVGKEEDAFPANRINNNTIILILLLTVVNVFLSAFEVTDSHPVCPFLRPVI